MLLAIVAYALSPIDLIPDFIPVLGLLDDLVLLPLAIVLALRLVPVAVLDECRARVQAQRPEVSRIGRAGAIAIALLWLVLAALTAAWIWANFA